MSITHLLSIIKAWPTREERLRKGMAVATKKPEDDGNEQQSNNRTDAELKRAARLLKLRAAQHKRRRALSETQAERRSVPEAK